MNTDANENSPSAAQVGRTQWQESDVLALSSDDRAVAIMQYQRDNYPNNIRLTAEMFELWLARPQQPADFAGSIYLPSRTGLTYESFVEVWREVGRRVSAGVLDGRVALDRHSDIQNYQPKE